MTVIRINVFANYFNIFTLDIGKGTFCMYLWYAYPGSMYYVNSLGSA